MSARRTALVWLAGLVLLPFSASGLRIEPSKELLSAEVIASGLRGPAGLATDPSTKQLYVAEREGNCISAIRDRKAVPVLVDQFTISDFIDVWALSKERTVAFWTQPVFRKPTGISFDSKGYLYVAESGKGGRVLQFEPLRDGQGLAHAVATPWVETTYGFTSIAADGQGRLFLTTQDADGRFILANGSVCMREKDNNWMMVDFGPFAEFSNVAITPSGDIMAVGEYRTAGVSWYDTERQMEIGTIDNVKGIRHLAIMPDGTTLGSLIREDGSWSVVEIDPIDKNILEWVGGLTEIGGLFADPGSGEVFVSLSAEGKIMRIRRLNESAQARENKLKLLNLSFELDKALPPKEWPEFFRKFIEKLGVVQAVDKQGQGPMAAKGGGTTPVPMTMKDFALAVPVVAGKVKATLVSPSELEKDPIEEISFVLFYPNQSMVTKQTIAPSISLLKVKHRSGRVVQTRFMPNRAGQPLTEDMPWNDMPEILVSFPSGYFAKDTGLSEEGLIRVYFLGMGLGPDYWIDVNRLHQNKSRMVVEKIEGTKIEYTLEPYSESLQAGGKSILVAGIKTVEQGWFKIGVVPILWNIINEEERPFNFKHGIKLPEFKNADVMTEPTIADVPVPTLAAQKPKPAEVAMCRKLVLRAATRWSSSNF